VAPHDCHHGFSGKYHLGVLIFAYTGNAFVAPLHDGILQFGRYGTAFLVEKLYKKNVIEFFIVAAIVFVVTLLPPAGVLRDRSTSGK